MIVKVISGGQTGADQAGLRAARAAGVVTGGWAPRGWLTEAGPAPWLAGFGLVCEDLSVAALPGSAYRVRTRLNVRDSDLTLWFGDAGSPGGKATRHDCGTLEKTLVVVRAGETRPSEVAARLGYRADVKVLNVAGSRESRCPGIGARVERFLAAVFANLR